MPSSYVQRFQPRCLGVLLVAGSSRGAGHPGRHKAHFAEIALGRAGLTGPGDSSPEPAKVGSLADVAQLVEHFTRNEGVPGSSPGVGLDSRKATSPLLVADAAG